MSMVTLNLNTKQARVLYELINLTGVELTQIDADYGTDSIEDIVQREIPELSEVNVRREAGRLFDLLEIYL